MMLPNAEPRTDSFIRRLWPAVAVIAGALCYFGALFNDYAYDDSRIVRDNPRIRNLADFRQIWLSDWWAENADDSPGADPARDRLYRPLTIFSFALNYAVGDVNPFGYHLVNLILHALACWLVWRLTLRLFDDVLIAGAAALLFAVHPIHAEAVASVVGRAEILSAVFMLAGLLALLPRSAPPNLGRVLLTLPLFAAALLSKETAVCYPAMALLALHAAYSKRASLKWLATRAALLLLPVLAYLPLRYFALGGRLIRVKSDSLLFLPLHDATWFERLHGPFTILGHYFRLLLTPNKLSCEYGPAIFDSRRGPDVMTLIGLLVAAGLIIALFGYRNTASATRRRLAVCAAMFIGAYALISNSVLLIGISFADRLMYWPSVPLFMAAAVGAAYFWRAHCVADGAPQSRKTLVRLCAVMLIFALGLRSIVRAADWKNNETLFAADLKTDPENPILNHCYAGVLLARAQTLDEFMQTAEVDVAARAAVERDALLDDAVTLLNRAVDAEARFSDALARLGEVYALRGQTDEAVRALESALLLNPAYMRSKQLLTHLRDACAPLNARIETLEQLLQKSPNDVAARSELARALIDLGRADEALPHAEAAARGALENPAVLKLYAEALMLNMRRDEAAAVYLRVLSYDPADWEVHSNLVTLLAGSDPVSALYHARVAEELKPDDLRAQINLAEAYALNGQRDEALRRLRDIARRLPENNPHRPLVNARIAELERSNP